MNVYYLIFLYKLYIDNLKKIKTTLFYIYLFYIIFCIDIISYDHIEQWFTTFLHHDPFF